MKVRRRRWTDAEIAAVRARYADELTAVIAGDLGRPPAHVYALANRLGLHKSETFRNGPLAARLRPGHQHGKATQFGAGHAPWNKGQPFVAGGRSSETRFRPGHRGGRAAERYKPIGTERLSKDGILQRKVNDDFPLQARWKAVHAIVWEEANGPIPPGHFVVFRDSDRTNIVLDNLELVSRIENMRRNTLHNLPKEIADLYQLKGAVTRQINKRAKK